jgi:HemY protein
MTLLFRAIIILVLVLGAILLVQESTEEPGQVMLQWYGYEVATSATILVAAVNIVIILAFFVGWFFSWVASLPSRLHQAFHRRQDKHALALIAQGIEALEAGDIKQQEKLANQISKALPDPNLASTLSAHLCPTQERLHGLLARKETSFAGHSGLMQEAVSRQDWSAVKFHAAAALKRRPSSPTAQKAYFDALLHTGDFAAALDQLPKLKRAGVLEREAPLVEAAVRLHAAMDEPPDNAAAALRQAQYAQKACLMFTPAALFRASTQLGLGKPGPAERTLSEFWHTCPRFDVFQKWFDALVEAAPNLEEDKLLKRVEELVKPKLRQPDEAGMACLCLGAAALRLGKTEEARKHLTKAFQKSASRTVLKQLADLEKREGDEAAAHDWLAQAVDAKELAQPGDDVLLAYQNFRRTYGLDTAKSGGAQATFSAAVRPIPDATALLTAGS